MSHRAMGMMLLLVCTGMAARGVAGERTSIQGLGMSRTYMGVARGIDAVGINPGAIDADSATLTFGLFPFGVHVGSDFMTYDLYDRYFTGEQSANGRVSKSLTNADKQDILASFPNGIGSIGVDVEARVLGIALQTGLGTAALTITEKASAAVKIPRSYAEFLFYGNTPGSSFDFSDSRVSGWWIREYAFSLASTWEDALGFDKLGVGVSAKMIHGYGYAELTRFNSKLTTGTDGVLHGTIDMRSRSAGIDPIVGAGGNYSPFTSPAGSGLGLDLGVAADVSPLLRVGLSVTDIGSIRWSKNVREATAESTIVVDNPLDEDQRNAVEDALKGENHQGTAFTTPLPTTIRAGAALSLTRNRFFRRLIFGNMIIACDLAQTLNEAPGYVVGTRFSLGMEWAPLPFLPLRFGYGWGGPDHTNLAMGFGLHAGFFEFDVASDNVEWLVSPRTFSYGSASMGMKLKF